jgi:hypothetical protein
MGSSPELPETPKRLAAHFIVFSSGDQSWTMLMAARYPLEKPRTTTAMILARCVAHADGIVETWKIASESPSLWFNASDLLVSPIAWHNQTDFCRAQALQRQRESRRNEGNEEIQFSFLTGCHLAAVCNVSCLLCVCLSRGIFRT